jgi:hypothetical protein
MIAIAAVAPSPLSRLLLPPTATVSVQSIPTARPSIATPYRVIVIRGAFIAISV